MNVTPVHCPVCENKCSPQAPTCPQCGHHLKRLGMADASPLIVWSRFLFGWLTAICAIAGIATGLQQGVPPSEVIASGLTSALFPGMLWLLTFVNKVA